MTVFKRVLYLLGQIGVMCLARFFFQWLLKFADTKGASGGEVLFVAASVGALFLVARVVDAAIDPLVGTWSDGWVARGRKRRQLLLFTFLLAPIGLVLAFSPTLSQSPAVRWTLLGGGLAIFFFGYTAYAIPLWSLVDDYGGESDRERSILSNLLGAGILVAVFLIAGAVPPLVDRFGFGTAALIVAVPSTVLMLLAYFSQPKGFVQNAATGPSAHEGVSLAAMFGVLKDKRFLAILLMFAGSEMALTVISAAAPFVCVTLLHGSDGDVAKLMLPFLGLAIPCFALVPALSRRIGWEKAMLYATVGLAVVYMGTASLGSSIIGSPMVTAMIVFGCGGPMVAVLLGLESEAVANSARAAKGAKVSLYFGIFNLCVKALNGLATFLTSLLVTLSTDRPELAAIAVRAMGLMAGVLLFIGLGLYFVVRPKQAQGVTS